MRGLAVVSVVSGLIFSAAPAIASPGPVLLADANRDGRVGWADRTGKDPAIFLPNLDDDAKRCQVTEADLRDEELAVDERLVACNDAQDDVVNGPLDAEDFAPLRIMPGRATKDTTLSLGPGEGRYARLWIKHAGTWASLGDSGTITAQDLRNGAEFGLEGRDVVRDKAVWNGVVTVSLGTTSVRLRVAPLILQSDLKPPRQVLTSRPGPRDYDFGYDKFLADLKKAAPETTTHDNADPWFQDMFEPTTASMPGPTGPKIIRILLRSPNYKPAREDWDGPHPAMLRVGGRVVFSALRGPDVGVVQQYTTQRDVTTSRDTLNSTGNFESLPPYRGFPLGRPLYGSTPEGRPDPTFTKLIDSQYADPVVIDTSWLIVGHADETVHVIPARNARGWTLMVADPRLAISLLRQASKDGHGGEMLFNDLPHGWDFSIDRSLAEQWFTEPNEIAAGHLDAQVAVLLKETGLTERDLVRVPVLFEQPQPDRLRRELREAPQQRLVTFSPGIPNGISLDGNIFGAPEPHGPRINGTDLFKTVTEQALAGTPVQVKWIEDWEFAHERQGEVHCVTNALHDPTRADWWSR
ncbi:protein-arginine deiminase family protein [Lentzea sp. NPDC051838]|uniref:protein-arginine deiminase family protein n=1 Tax=Lentzea sp. NPDC051838 TaxID=3154849 RepID=UPI00341D1E4B